MLIFNIKFCDVMEDIMSYIRKNLYYFGKIGYRTFKVTSLYQWTSKMKQFADVIFLVKFAGEHRAH
jgi:hypothetical protein